MPTSLRRTAAVLGALSLIAAALLTFVIVPGQAQLPSDTDSVRIYDGQVDTLLNAEALAAGELGDAVLRDLPVQIEQRVTVTDVADGDATVSETASIALPDGTPLLQTASEFTVDRRTMQSQGDTDGLVIGWPIDPEPVDTTVWSGPLQAAVPAVYETTEARGGIDALRFTATESGRIVDAEWLSTVPEAVPSALLGILATALDAPAAVTDQLASAGDLLPASVPLGYLIDATTTYWVHPTTGMVIDAEVSESRNVALDIPGFDTTPVAAVLSVTYAGNADSVAAVVTEAEDLAGQLSLFGTTLPIALTLLGVGLLVLATISSRRKRADIDLTGDGKTLDLTDEERPTVGSTR